MKEVEAEHLKNVRTYLCWILAQSSMSRSRLWKMPREFLESSPYHPPIFDDDDRLMAAMKQDS